MPALITSKVHDSSSSAEQASCDDDIVVPSMMRQMQAPHPNRLSKREMESLTALCDTLLPSVDVDTANSNTKDDDLNAFYGTSASMAGTHDHVGGLISGGLPHPAIVLLRPALWLLSTWYGTFLLCGWSSLSTHFPFFQNFSKIGHQKREEILLSWSLSSFFLLNMLFKGLKYLTMLIFFTQINGQNDNPAWRALGYCGPDPAFKATLKHNNEGHDDDMEKKEEKDDDYYYYCSGPLHASLLHMDNPFDAIFRQLRSSGFPAPIPPSPSSPLLTLRCDAVLVGSGSGGSIVAGVLASAGYKVLVLEKGSYYARNSLTLLEGPTTRTMYEGGGMAATDNLGVLILAGSTVGGGSTINWSASIRTPDHVRKEWCDKHGLELFGSKDFDRALDAVCERMGVQSDIDREGFNNAVLRKGCTELGYPISSVPCNAPPDHYCGWCNFGCKDGKKKGTQETWLSDLASSGNGLILPQCKAIKVPLLHHRSSSKELAAGMIKGGRRNVARGIVAESICNKQQFVIESKVTVIGCGALNTPGLLKRSGLRNKNIGKHLHLHPSILAWGYFPAAAAESDDHNNSSSSATGGGTSWPEDTMRSYEGGILTSMSTAVANFDTSGYGAILQTPALHPGMFSILTPWVSAAEFRKRMTRFSRTAHIFALARDRGSGTVDYPKTVKYQLHGEDEENLKKGLEVALRVLVAAGAKEVGTMHGRGERIRVEEDGGWVEKVMSRGLMVDSATPISSAHQMGSCRMGVNPEEGAVSPEGETWEVEGLYVADTSVFPTALGVNPMVTVQAISYCIAQTLLRVLASTSNM